MLHWKRKENMSIFDFEGFIYINNKQNHSTWSDRLLDDTCRKKRKKRRKRTSYVQYINKKTRTRRKKKAKTTNTTTIFLAPIYMKMNVGGEGRGGKSYELFLTSYWQQQWDTVHWWEIYCWKNQDLWLILRNKNETQMYKF